MLVPERTIVLDSYYLGPGKGCSRILRCDDLDYERKLDCGVMHSMLADARRELEDLAFRRFRDGNYRLEPGERDLIARSIIALDDPNLIDLMFTTDAFECEIVRRELQMRGLNSSDLYPMGRFGDERAKDLAIKLMKERGRHENSAGKAECGEPADARESPS